MPATRHKPRFVSCSTTTRLIPQRQTQAYLELHRQRFEFVFTPKHGSWLNIIETLFSKMTRSMLREIRVASKQELIDRIHLYFPELNADPVIFRWRYKMDEATNG